LSGSWGPTSLPSRNGCQNVDSGYWLNWTYLKQSVPPSSWVTGSWGRRMTSPAVAVSNSRNPAESWSTQIHPSTALLNIWKPLLVSLPSSSFSWSRYLTHSCTRLSRLEGDLDAQSSTLPLPGHLFILSSFLNTSFRSLLSGRPSKDKCEIEVHLTYVQYTLFTIFA
jgi:hypothetical protein